MRLWHKLAITAVVLGLLGWSYFYVSNINVEVKDDKKPVDKSISLFDAKSDDVKEIHIKNPKAEYTIAKVGDKWSIKEYPQEKYSYTKVENTVYDLVSINANSVVEENATDFAKYGLTNPLSEVSITLNDASKRSFMLGNKVDGFYYFKDVAAPKVYVIDSYKGDAMLKALADYREEQTVSINPEEVTGFKVQYKDGKLLDIGKKDPSDKMGSVSAFAMKSPNKASINTDRFNEILKALLPVNSTGFVSSNLADVPQYGLDKPDFIVNVYKEEQVMTIKMSRKDKVYAILNDNSSIVTIDESKYNAISGIDMFAITDKFTHLINIEGVNSIVVEGKGAKHTLEIARTIVATATPDPQTKQKPEDSEYKVNSKKAEESAFKGAYQAIIGLIATGTTNAVPQGEAEYTITFNYRNGTSEAYKYVSVDYRNYAVQGNTGTVYTILKKNVDSMMEKVSAFDKEPSKRPE